LMTKRSTIAAVKVRAATGRETRDPMPRTNASTPAGVSREADREDRDLSWIGIGAQTPQSRQRSVSMAWRYKQPVRGGGQRHLASRSFNRDRPLPHLLPPGLEAYSYEAAHVVGDRRAGDSTSPCDHCVAVWCAPMPLLFTPGPFVAIPVA